MEKTKQVLAICLAGLISVMADDAQANQSALTEQLSIAPASESSTTPPVIDESEIPRLQELEQSATTVREWLAQSNAQATARITDIQLNTSIDRLAITLQTTADLAAITPSIVGNAWIADIPNAVLALPDAEAFQAADPTPGITLVSVTQLPNDRVRIAVTGTEAPPLIELSSVDQAWQLSITPGTVRSVDAEDELQVVVTGTEAEGYNPSTATTGTRIEAPLRDLPLTLQVIPREVIEDRQIVRLTELADNVPGVGAFSGYGGLASNDYYIRGFNTGESFRNGFRDFTFISPRDPANVERVEFLRGPASVLYGGGFNLTGAVNTVTKRPLTEPQYEIDATIGSYDFYRSTLDFTG